MSEPTELPPHPRDAEIWRAQSPDPNDLDSLFDEMGLTVRQWREARRCNGCGREQWDPDTDVHVAQVVKQCEHGCCYTWHCPDCDFSDSGFGPIRCGCGCED